MLGNRGAVFFVGCLVYRYPGICMPDSISFGWIGCWGVKYGKGLVFDFLNSRYLSVLVFSKAPVINSSAFSSMLQMIITTGIIIMLMTSDS
jgi:hypothetical protein